MFRISATARQSERFTNARFTATEMGKIISVFVGGVGWISPQDVKKQRHLPLVLSYRVDGMSKDGAYLSLELEPWEYDLLLEQTKNHYKNKEKRNTK